MKMWYTVYIQKRPGGETPGRCSWHTAWRAAGQLKSVYKNNHLAYWARVSGGWLFFSAGKKSNDRHNGCCRCGEKHAKLKEHIHCFIGYHYNTPFQKGVPTAHPFYVTTKFSVAFSKIKSDIDGIKLLSWMCARMSPWKTKFSDYMWGMQNKKPAAGYVKKRKRDTGGRNLIIF